MSEISRRRLLQGSAAVVAIAVLDIPIILPARTEQTATSLTPYLRIASDGSITAILPTLEMGQGTHTGQLMILAEELGADMASMKVEMPSQPSDAYRVKFGTVMRMRSVASQGIRFWHDPLRIAAAKARAVLIDAAAEKTKLPKEELDTAGGAVVHTATADDGKAFDSGLMRPKATFSITLKSAGTFAYHCTYHRWMKGTIIAAP